VRKDRCKEVFANIQAADDAHKFIVNKLGHSEWTFTQSMELFNQPNPNSTAQSKVMEPVEDPAQPNAPKQPIQK
jgi:hypothetical protein